MMPYYITDSATGGGYLELKSNISKEIIQIPFENVITIEKINEFSPSENSIIYLDISPNTANLKSIYDSWILENNNNKIIFYLSPDSTTINQNYRYSFNNLINGDYINYNSIEFDINWNIHRITSISLQYCDIVYLNLECFPLLSSLTLNYCYNCEQLNIKNYENMKALSIVSCPKLTNIYEKIPDMINITSINVGQNGLYTLPDLSNVFDKLEYLFIYNNYLSGELDLSYPKLKSVNAGGNFFTSINFGNESFHPSLTAILIHQNNIKEFKYDCSICTSLNLHSNDMEKLELTNFNNLTTLRCEKNMLRSINLDGKNITTIEDLYNFLHTDSMYLNNKLKTFMIFNNKLIESKISMNENSQYVSLLSPQFIDNEFNYDIFKECTYEVISDFPKTQLYPNLGITDETIDDNFSVITNLSNYNVNFNYLQKYVSDNEELMIKAAKKYQHINCVLNIYGAQYMLEDKNGIFYKCFSILKNYWKPKKIYTDWNGIRSFFPDSYIEIVNNPGIKSNEFKIFFVGAL